MEDWKQPFLFSGAKNDELTIPYKDPMKPTFTDYLLRDKHRGCAWTQT